MHLKLTPCHCRTTEGISLLMYPLRHFRCIIDFRSTHMSRIGVYIARFILTSHIAGSASVVECGHLPYNRHGYTSRQRLSIYTTRLFHLFRCASCVRAECCKSRLRKLRTPPTLIVASRPCQKASMGAYSSSPTTPPILRGRHKFDGPDSLTGC